MLYNYKHVLFGKTTLDELYASSLVRHLAMAMVNIFVPIYLFQLGYTVPFILFFYAIKSGFHALFSHISAKVCFKTGIRKTILLSTPLLIAFYMILSQNMGPDFIIVAAALLGMSDAFYWIPFHIYFVKASDYKNRGKEVGVYDALVSIAAFVGPLIGVVLFALYGFSTVFVIVGFMIFASIVPLFFTENTKPKERYSLGKFNTNLMLSSIGHGMRLSVDEVVWPIFVFLVLGSAVMFGYLAAFGMLVSLVVIIIASLLADKHKKRKMLATASISESAIWVIRAVLSSIQQFFVVEIVFRVAQIMRWLPFQAMFYNRAAASRHIVSYTVQREIGIHAGVVIACVLGVIIFKITGILQLLFIFAVVGSFMHIFMARKKGWKK